MNLLRNRTVLLLPLLIAVGLAGFGCRSNPKPKPVRWNVSITKVTTSSIEADLIGVTPSEKSYYAGLTMEEYWRPGSPVRRDAKPMSMILQRDQAWVIARDDPKWNEWLARGVTELLVVANLPVPNGLWKVPIPLDKKGWDAEDKTLVIEVHDTLIRVQTPQKMRN